MNYEKMFGAMLAQSKSCRKERVALDEKERKLQESVKALADICRPYCVEAVERYNIGQSLMIAPREISLSFSLENRSIHLSLCLRNERGDEPDEWFDERNLKKIESKLGPAINKLLSKNKIPLTFGGASVPASYYPK
jgi:hypothetical protein